jgi:undecaprenyl-diphosphatase
MGLQWFVALDQQLLHSMNGSDSLFLDGMMRTISSGYTWIPLYLALLYIVIRNNENMNQIMLIIGCSAICLVLSEGVADGIAKPLVERLRPTYDPMIRGSVDIVDGITGPQPYGFFSAHAANTFGIALLFILIVRSRILSVTLVIWSLLNGYSRIYLGVHYPGDVICGLLWGSVSAIIAYIVYWRVHRKIASPDNYISSQYTNTGYSFADIDIVQSIFAFTMLYVMIRSLIYCY